MIASVLAVLTVGSAVLQGNDNQFELKSDTRKVLTESGDEIEVSGRIVVELGGLGVDYNSEERKVARSTTARPNQPAAGFTLSYLDAPMIDAGRKDAALFKAYLEARELGAGTDVGKWLAQKVNLNLSRGQIKEFDVDIAPNMVLREGGWTKREWGHRRVEVVRNVRFAFLYRENGKPKSMLLETVSVPVGAGWMPQSAFLKESFTPDERDSKDVRDTLGGVSIVPPMKMSSTLLTFPQFPKGSGREFSTTTKLTVDPAKYFADVFKENGQESFGQLGLDTKYSGADLVGFLRNGAPIGTGLNSMVFPEIEQEGDPCGMTLTAPPGTMWVPDKPGYQVMTTGSRFNLTYGFSELTAGVSLQGRDPRTMMTMCLNMNLKEPDGKVRYFPYRPNDGAMKALAEITDGSRFKGPWDQARLWTYTDRAPLAELNKRLLPRVNLRQYAEGLMDIVRIGGFSSEEVVKRKMLLPEALGASRGTPELMAWAVAVLEEHDPKGVAQWLKEGPKELLEKLSGEEEDQKAAEQVIGGLMRSGDAGVLDSVLVALEKVGDVSTIKGKVGSLREVLYSGDIKIVERGLDLLPELAGELPRDALEYLSESGGTPEIKSKAASLLGGG